MSKFTSGPWKVSRCGLIVSNPQTRTIQIDIASVFDGWIDFNGDEAKANAQLIATSPELFEQLRVMTALCRLKYDGTDPAFMAEILKSEAVISKARGEI